MTHTCANANLPRGRRYSRWCSRDTNLENVMCTCESLLWNMLIFWNNMVRSGWVFTLTAYRYFLTYIVHVLRQVVHWRAIGPFPLVRWVIASQPWAYIALPPLFQMKITQNEIAFGLLSASPPVQLILKPFFLFLGSEFTFKLTFRLWIITGFPPISLHLAMVKSSASWWFRYWFDTNPRHSPARASSKLSGQGHVMNSEW